MAAQPQIAWIFVCGCLAAFAFGWGTGANDVANAFGTSVGAKTLKLWHAVVLAAIFEFAGALVLGRVSTSTISGGIADITVFYSQPEVYAYGMLVALAVGAIWQGWASYMEMNVSATHSIIGGIIGFAIAYDGLGAVNWATKVTDGSAFPPYKGVLPIVLSWFISPLLTGAAAASLFFILRWLVLRRKNSYLLSLFVLPPLVTLTVFVNLYFVFTKGAKKMLSNNSDWDDTKAAWVSAVCAIGLGILTTVIAVPFLRYRILKKERDQVAANEAAAAAEMVEVDVEGNAKTKGPDSEAVEGSTLEKSGSSRLSRVLTKGKSMALHGFTVDVHAIVEEDPIVAAMHSSAEVFDPKAEHAFSYLQVFSAICVILSHGAGEVGYMSGPLGTIWDVYQTGFLSKSTDPPIWIIVIGALGLVTGLATYGYNVTRAMGTRMAKLSPSRGFCAELSTAFVIMIAAQYGLPTSSSQCITGGIVGVGLLEGLKGVNWRFFAAQFFGWVSTVVLVACTVAAVFSQAIYAPSKFEGNQILQYEAVLANYSAQMYKNFNVTLQSYYAASNQSLLTNLNISQWKALNSSVNSAYTYTTRLVNTKYTQTVYADTMCDALTEALALYQQYSVMTLGQNEFFPWAQVCNNNNTAALAAGESSYTCPPALSLPKASNVTFTYPFP